MRSVARSSQQVGLPVAAMLLLLAAWQAAVSLAHVPEYVLPAPGVVGSTVLAQRDLLLMHAGVTLEETLLGFALALVVGCVLAIIMTLWRSLHDALFPLVILTQVIPKVAITPLVVLYLGFGQSPKVFLAFVIAFFPVVINTTLGLNSISPDLVEMMASLGADRWQVMTKVRLRRAIPYVVEGSKITMTLAVIGAIVAELDSGNSGLGYLIKYASSEVDTALAFASLFVLVAMGILLFELVDVLGRLALPPGGRKVELAGSSRWTS